MDVTPASVFSTLDLVRKTRPIVHNITNYVAMDFIANGLLALGASPIMAFAEEEIEEIIRISGGLSLNIGTLDSQFISRAKTALRVADRTRKPCVLDPVGCGASLLRTEATRELVECRAVQILRGNGSEIQAVSQQPRTTRGVDSAQASTEVLENAKDLAQRYSTTVVVSGETDVITDGERTFVLSNGHPMMTQVTGMGCLASSVCAAFLAVEKDVLKAALSAMAVMGLCGELAGRNSTVRGPGSFRVAFLDVLSGLDEEDVHSLLRIEVW